MSAYLTEILSFKTVMFYHVESKNTEILPQKNHHHAQGIPSIYQSGNYLKGPVLPDLFC